MRVDVDGLQSLVSKLEILQKDVAKKVLMAGVRAGLNAIGSQIKKDLDPRLTEAKRSVRSKIKIRRKGQVIAKVGFGVGPRNRKRSTTLPRGSKRGVGIGANNIHWWLIGTKNRYTGRRIGRRTGNPIRHRGMMIAQQPGLVNNAVTRSRSKSEAAVIKSATRQLNKQAANLRRMK